jgi:hypothetical protein
VGGDHLIPQATRLPSQLCGDKFVKKKVLTLFWRFSYKGRLRRVFREKLNSATMSTYEKAIHFTIHACPP